MNRKRKNVNPKTAILAFALLAAALANGQQPVQRPGGVGFGGEKIQPQTEAELATNREKGELVQAYRQAFASGNLAAARRACSRRLGSDPEDVRAACDLADVAFRQGRFEEAYDALFPFMKPDATSDVRLRGAFAAARLGRKRRDLDDYCRRHLLQAAQGEVEQSLPAAGTKGAAEICAALALGTSSYSQSSDPWSKMYCEFVVAQDRNNPLANYRLGEISLRMGKPERAESYLKAATIRARGRLAQSAKAALDKAKRSRSTTAGGR